MKTRWCCWGILMFYAFALSASEAAQVDALFQSAVQQVGKVSREESLKAFQDIISKDSGYAPAYNELANLYLQSYSVDGRQQARLAIRHAIELDPDNVAYQLTRAKILWAQGFRDNTFDAYEKVLKRHPQNTEALDGAGMFLVYDYLAMKDELNGVGRDYSGYARKERKEAKKVLLKSIELDIRNQRPYYLLGMLYFEDRRFPEFLSLMRRLQTLYPDDKNALLFCGLACYQVGQFDKANAYYEKALARMDFGERTVMESIDLLKQHKGPDGSVERLPLNAAYASNADDEAREFWKRHDPLYLSDYNERKLEHFGRIAYANLRFRQFSQAVDGWQTDMGKTWIKFGPYYSRRSDLMGRGEIWFYEKFKIEFQGNGADVWTFGGGGADVGALDIRLRPSRSASAFKDTNAVAGFFKKQPMPKLDSIHIEEPSIRVFRKEPQRYIDPYLNRKYTLPHLVAAFQERDSVRMELSYMIPRARLAADPKSGKVAIVDGVFLFDSQWRDVYRYRKPAAFRLPALSPKRTSADSIRENYLLVYRTVRVPMGTYHLAVELLNEGSGSLGVAREEDRFAFEEDAFQLSDLLLASNIRTKKAFPESRDDLVVTPNPLRTFSRSESVFLYLELYHLQRDAYGRTQYEIAYTIGKPEAKTVSPLLFTSQRVVDTLGTTRIDIYRKNGRERSEVSYKPAPQWKVERSRGKAEARTVASEYEGHRANDFTYLQIDVKQVPAGIYQLTVMAKDKASGAQDEKQVMFRIVE